MGDGSSGCEDRWFFLKELSFADYNPRRMSREQMRSLESSLRRFGQVEPIIVNRREDGRYVVVGGHQRVRALSKIGEEKCLARVVRLGSAEERLLNLALNKTVSSFDSDVVDSMLVELDSGEDSEESVMGLGFTRADVEQAKAAKTRYSNEIDQKHQESHEEKTEEKTGNEDTILVSFGFVRARVQKDQYVSLLSALEGRGDPEEVIFDALFSDFGGE